MAMSNLRAEPTESSDGNYARDVLLRRMSDLAVLPPGRLTVQERGLVDSVVATAISRLDITTRRRLAERIAQMPEGPPELSLALARDEIEVAGPVLRNNMGLQPGDLAQIVRDATPEHRLAIAERKSLPGAVVDALVECAESNALCHVLANPSAEISTRSLDILVRRSSTEPDYQPLLLQRSELTVRLAQLMFWWVGSDARREILTRYSVERRMMYAALDDVLDEGLAAGAGDEGLQAALSLMRVPVVVTKQQVARLMDHAIRHQRNEFIAELSFIGRVRPETAFRIFMDVGGEPLAVFSKAIGMARNDFSDMLTALAPIRVAGADDEKNHERIIKTFDMTSNDRADLALHCWDWAISAEAQVSSDA